MNLFLKYNFFLHKQYRRELEEERMARTRLEQEVCLGLFVIEIKILKFEINSLRCAVSRNWHQNDDHYVLRPN